MIKLYEALSAHSVVPDHRSPKHVRQIIKTAWETAKIWHAGEPTIQSSVIAAALVNSDNSTRVVLLGNSSRNSESFMNFVIMAQSNYQAIAKNDPVSAKLLTRLGSIAASQGGF